MNQLLLFFFLGDHVSVVIIRGIFSSGIKGSAFVLKSSPQSCFYQFIKKTLKLVSDEICVMSYIIYLYKIKVV